MRAAVFECVGSPGMIAEAVRQSRLHGRVIVVGACMEQDHFLPILALQKETLMAFSLGHDREDFRFVVESLERGTIDPSPLVTGVVDFAAFPAAFEGMRSAKDGCKLLLKPN